MRELSWLLVCPAINPLPVFCSPGRFNLRFALSVAVTKVATNPRLVSVLVIRVGTKYPAGNRPQSKERER